MNVIDDDDDAFEDFSNYKPTTHDPGWGWTYSIILLCLIINSMLPFLLFRARRNDRRNKQKESLKSTSAATQSVKESQDDDASVVSISRTIVSQVALTVLGRRANKGVYHRQEKRKRKGKGRRFRAHASGVAYDPSDDRSIYSSSVDSYSVLGKLDGDDVSVRDAVDAMDFGTPPGVDDAGGDKLTPGERFVDSSTWDKEMKKIVSLWIPYSVAGAAEGLSYIINFAVFSHFIGAKAANAYVSAVILTEFTDALTYGFIEAIGVLGPQADGAGNDLLVGRYMQIGLIFYTIGTIPSIILWSWMMEPAVLWLGFDLETAQIAQGYAYPLVTMGFIGGAGEVLDAFLEFMDHETYAMFMEIFAVGIDLVVIIIMVTSGVKDLVLIGIVQVLVGFLLMILSITIVLCNGWLDDVWEGLALSFGLKDKRAVKNMVKTAIPLGISYVLTYGEWEIMTLFAKFMGPAEVAAWGVLGFLWDTFEYTIDGLADAVEVRVGKGMGAGDTQSARSSAYKGLYLSIVISVYSAAFLFIVSGHLPKWLTPDPTLQRLIFETLPLIGFGEVLMSVGMVCWNVVGAQGRVRLATTIEFFVSWFLVIPMAAVLVYIFNFNLMGMVGPLVLGYTVGSVAITYLLVRSDWEGLSRKVIEINGGNISYDEYDWDDLPPLVREAALVLGYKQELWDNDKEPPTSNKEWRHLTAEEMAAAKKLGFDQAKWDDDETDSAGKTVGTGNEYDDFDWNELPKNIQDAARVLGYTDKIWDKDKEPSTCDKDWKELTITELEAAVKLGYNQQKWDAHDNSDSESVKGRSQVSKSATRNDASASYESYDWKDLPHQVQVAARDLGYTSKMWDSNKEPKSSDKYWHKLVPSERAAARVLGYDENTWNDDGSGAQSLSVNYDDLTWRKLRPEVQTAAMVLGYTAKMWNNDQEPSSSGKDWKNLSEAERKAADVLGYNKQKWDGGGDDKMSTPKYDDLTWRKLPPTVQEAAIALGYDAKMWNNDKEPTTCDKDWFDLTSQEMSAARVLGYNKEKWEGGNDDEPTTANYNDLTWRKLPPQLQQAAIVLGYDAKMWNNDKEPATCNKDWKQLTDVEQAAANKLGYSQQQWDK